MCISLCLQTQPNFFQVKSIMIYLKKETKQNKCILARAFKHLLRPWYCNNLNKINFRRRTCRKIWAFFPDQKLGKKIKICFNKIKKHIQINAKLKRHTGKYKCWKQCNTIEHNSHPQKHRTFLVAQSREKTNLQKELSFFQTKA